MIQRQEYDIKAFGLRLRQCRERAHLTQHELAQHLGVNPITIHLWETGKQRPSKKNLQRLAHFFFCTPEWLMHGQGEPHVEASKVLEPMPRPLESVGRVISPLKDDLLALQVARRFKLPVAIVQKLFELMEHFSTLMKR